MYLVRLLRVIKSVRLSFGRAEALRMFAARQLHPSFFQAAKMPTLLGRNFIPEDYGSGRQQVAILSHRLWQQRFRGDPRIIGSTIRFNGQAFTVVGIMPRTFDVPSGVDIWVPKAG